MSVRILPKLSGATDKRSRRSGQEGTRIENGGIDLPNAEDKDTCLKASTLAYNDVDLYAA